MQRFGMLFALSSCIDANSLKFCFLRLGIVVSGAIACSLAIAFTTRLLSLDLFNRVYDRPPLLIILLQQFPSIFMSLLGTPPKTEQLLTVKPNHQPIPLSQLLQIADAALPEGKTTFISFSG